MEKVIELIFNIEKRANQIMECANTAKAELFEENENAIAQMEAEIAEVNNTKIRQLDEQAEKELELEKQQLITDSNQQLVDLEADYRKNHDALVDQVFQSIIQI